MFSPVPALYHCTQDSLGMQHVTSSHVALSGHESGSARGLSKAVLSLPDLRTLCTHDVPPSDKSICLQWPKFLTFYRRLLRCVEREVL